MTARLRIALAPLAAWSGDVAGNAARIRAALAEAARLGADLLVTPQGSLSRDLPAAEEIEALAAETADGGPGLVLGAPWSQGDKLHDAAFLLDGGRVLARRARHAVRRGEPFDPGPGPGPVAFRGVRLGLLIGDDRAAPAVAETLAETGAELLLAMDAAPFRPGEASRRLAAAVAIVVESGLAFAYLNRLGGEAGLVCDGAGFVLNPDRSLALQLPAFTGGVVVTEWHGGDGWACAPQPLAPDLPDIEAQRRALLLGIAEQVAQAGRRQALVVLSGDPGSTRLAALAVEALGPARVSALVMPGEDAPPGAAAEAEGLARRLGIGCRSIPIAPAQAAFAGMLGTPVEASRIRAVTLATLAASLGAVPLMPADWPDELDGAAQPSSTPYGAEPGP